MASRSAPGDGLCWYSSRRVLTAPRCNFLAMSIASSTSAPGALRHDREPEVGALGRCPFRSRGLALSSPLARTTASLSNILVAFEPSAETASHDVARMRQIARDQPVDRCERDVDRLALDDVVRAEIGLRVFKLVLSPKDARRQWLPTRPIGRGFRREPHCGV